MKEKITNLIVRSLFDDLTLKEKILLKEWLKDKDNQLVYDRLKNQKEDLLGQNQVFDKQKALKLFQKRRKGSSYLSIRKVMRYAAIFIFGLLGSYYFIQFKFEQPQPVKEELTKVDKDQIQLKLSTGELITLNKGTEDNIQTQSGQKLNVKSQGVLVYNAPVGGNEVPETNTLFIPFGKKFQLSLADGTKIHLNAGSSLTYPSFFIPGQAREVILDGEGFFEVTSSEEMPFYVKTSGLNVKVTGTKFNLAHYQNESTMQTVLVEGVVSLLNQENENITVIEPSQLALWDVKTQELNIKKVDVSLYTSWVNGDLIFKNNSFDEILSKLERHFAVEIILNHEELKEQSFTAAFYETATLQEILNFFAKDTPFEYTYNSQNKVTINKVPMK